MMSIMKVLMRMKILLISYFGFFLPDLYAAPTKTPLIFLEINGENLQVEAGQIPTLIRGDTLRLKHIEINKAKSDRLDIHGIETAVIEGQLPHDENVEIETKNFKASSVIVTAYREEKEFFKFKIPLKSPEWSYSELKINQKNTVTRPGDRLSLKATDQIQFVRLETNLDQNDRVNIKFEPKVRQKGVLTSRLVFYYRDYAFGSVPIQLTAQ